MPALVWTANLAALELHTPQARAAEPWQPSAIVFDLDPGPGTDLADCARVALELHDLLDQLGLRAVAKTSGAKGLHLSVGIRPSVDAETTKGFALALGKVLESRDPKRVTVTMAKDQRGGRVFVDWSQNDRHKTTVCAYSLRATDTPGVSTPVVVGRAARARGRPVTSAPSRSRPPTCSNGSTSSATSTPTASPATRTCPNSADVTRCSISAAGGCASSRAPRPEQLGEHRHGGGLEVREAVQGRDDPAPCWASSVTFSTGHDERGDPVGDAVQS